MTYEDFEIRFGRIDGDVVHASAHWSGAAYDEVLRFPLLDGLEDTLTSVSDAVRALGDKPVRDLVPLVDGPDPRSVGAALFRSLFSGTIRDLYHQSLGRGKPLRIRLSMDLNDPLVTPLAALPWELMYDHERRETLLLGAQKTIVRSPHIPLPLELPQFRPPLRVLFVMANPRGDLNLTEERTRIEQAIAAENVTVHTEYLENATPQSLGDRLERLDYHVIHFMGHGGFRDGEGVLLLQDGEYRGSDLATLMRNEPETRLFVLNACRTGEISRVRGQDPFEGVATALLMSGMPAVVAMQFPVSDSAAIAFAGSFYAGIARGRPVDEAVAVARRQISRLAPGRHEWATPVLFLRSDGDLFTAPAPPRWQGAEVPRLLVYLLDRVALRRELETALELQRASGSVPLVGVIHGDDAQCHVELIERLQQKELPELIELDARGKITNIGLPWPTDVRSPVEFRQQLTPALATQMRKLGAACRTVDEISHALTALDGPALIYTHVVISELSAIRGWDPIREYLEYWNDFPQGTPSRRLFVFLSIKYRAQLQDNSAGWLRAQLDPAARAARKAAASAERVRTELLALSADSRFGRIVLRILPELAGITEQDVMSWATDHEHLYLARDIRDIYQERERLTGRRVMPMEEITERLKILLAKSNPRRDVA